jgi:hypothetical protein
VLSGYSPTTSAVYNFQGSSTGKLPDDAGSIIREDLGKQLVAGVESTGTRSSVIYNPNVFGNDRKVTIEREFWYSPKLGINLISNVPIRESVRKPLRPRISFSPNRIRNYSSYLTDLRS